MPRNVTLPDGRVLVIPDDASPDQLAALKLKLGAQYADLKTGEGMEQRAAQQAHASSNVYRPTEQAPPLSSNIMKPNYLAMGMSSPHEGLESGLSSPAQDPQKAQAMRTGAAIGGLAGGAISAPVAAGRALLGSLAGSYAGGHAGRYIGGETGEEIGKVGGGLVGGALGATGRSLPGRGDLLDLLTGKGAAQAEAEAPAVVPMTQSPNADTYSAVRAAQRATLRRELAGVGTPGSSAQETGWSPAVTKVPFPRAGGAQVTVQSVPGPDASGRENLLTPAAKRGVPRAGEELIRRGRSVLFTPDQHSI
jgi:hypothetical protein